MQTDQLVLFVAVVTLALALVVVVVGPRLRVNIRGGGSRQQATNTGIADPADAANAPGQRPVPAEAADAAAAAVAADGARAAAGRSSASPPPVPPQAAMVCPTCRRQYAAGLRFCPYDARVLARDVHPAMLEPEASLSGAAGKICPSCARRYDVVAVVCGRDGSALVSVN